MQVSFAGDTCLLAATATVYKQREAMTVEEWGALEDAWNAQ
jgi:hypothetical protein